MKTKLTSVIFLLIAHLSLLTAQIPQGFNYQAVARLTTGDPIINTTLPVRITIQADSLGTSIIWQELHSSVTTNGFGAFTLVLGKGARQAVSNVPTFSAIDWSVTPKFIKTEIDYSGWKTMGVTRFWSVPYSLTSANVTGTLSKLAVKGKTALNDEALFEVKNKDGQTIFAVYNEGVRVYVSDGAKGLKGGFAVGGFGTDKGVSTPYFVVGKDSVRVYLDTNPLTKKLKGGFAVGGYDLTKGIVVQDYLDVNSDSVRIYIDSNPATKKVKGGFAVGGYDMVKGTNTNYMNVNTDASGIINPSQNRVLWYPLLEKNAFLAGRILIHHPDSIGVNSVTTGYESRAKGRFSQAMGYKAIARGDYSTAIGKNALAGKINSFAFGDSAWAVNNESYAIGRGAYASGYRSFAFGSAGIDNDGHKTDVTRAIGDYSVAIGQGSRTYAIGSVSIGLGDTASGYYSTAIGYLNSAKGRFSTSLGYITSAQAQYSTAIGVSVAAKGSWSTVMGYSSYSKGWASVAIGMAAEAIGDLGIAIGSSIAKGYNSVALAGSNIASGEFSFAVCNGTQAKGHSSASMGFSTTARGYASASLGNRTIASGYASTSMGFNTKANSYASLVIGRYNDTTNISSTVWDPSDPLFVCGKGTSNSDRKNAFTVYKNGNAYLEGNLQVGSSSGPITSNWWEFGTDNDNGTAIDFHSWNIPSDFSARVYRQPGVNGIFEITNLGGGAILLQAQSGKVVVPNLPGTTSGSYLRIYNDQLYYYSSSAKTKTNIEPLIEDFYKILQASPVSFTDNASGERNIGYIAEDFDSIGLNNLVIYKDGEPTSLSYELVSLYNLEIIKDQQKAIKTQQQQIKSQQQQINELRDLVKRLISEKE